MAATPTTKQDKNKARNPRERASELPSAPKVNATDTSSLSRLELLRRRKLARLFAKANSLDSVET
jgi:hypothetical protein